MDDKTDKPVPEKQHKSILDRAMKRLKACEDAESENREEALKDFKFAQLGEQWDDDMLRDREGRPSLVVNKLAQYINQVVNEQRQSQQGIKVVGVDDKADRTVAEIETGLIRNIEYLSKADLAYDTAYEHAVTGGFGFFGVTTCYADEDTFDQDIRIRTFENCFAVHIDPASMMPDGSDMDYAFVTDKIEKEDYEDRYGEVYSGEDVPDDYAESWHDKDSVYVREYWERTREPVKLFLWSNGITTKEGEPAPEGAEIVREREAKEYKVKMYLICGDRVLSETEFPSRYIPIFPVYGKRLNVAGRVFIRGLVRFARDPQKMFNYWRSATAEKIALAPKTPIFATAKMVEGYENLYDSLNTTPHPWVPYNPDPLAPGATPSRIAADVDVMPIIAANQQSEEDIKASIGIYDPQLGMDTNQSGRAILALQKQGDTSTYGYQDNLSRAKEQCGRVIVELIGKLYDTERIVRVLGEDGGANLAVLNKRVPGPGGVMQILNDVTLGKYDVEVTTGPSYATKRMEAAESMIQFMQAYPAAAPVLGKHLAKNLDWPGADDVAAELAALSPGPGNPQEAVAQVAQQAEQAINAIRSEYETRIQQMEQDKAIEWAKLELEKEKVEISKDKLEFDKMKASLDAAADDVRVQQLAAGVMMNYLQAAEIEAQEELAEELNDAVDEQLQQAMELQMPIDESNVSLQNDDMPTGGFPG